MCGIAGVLVSGRNSRAVRATVELTSRLVHRGPDGEGFWCDTAPGGRLTRHELPDAAGIVFGHRRLAIVDVREGHQPMTNEDGTIWVAFNGEIYNAPELRADLLRCGHRFRTVSDTEVLVHGWEEWRQALFAKLNGIFAFALHDTRTRDTFLVRDPLGVKPLYVGTIGGMTWWSSELDAGRAAGLTTGRIDPEALKLYLTFRFTPSPRTILKDCWKIPPSHYVHSRESDAGRVPVFTRYDTTVRSSASPRTQREWQEAMLVELEQAVRRQLMSDVPVGALLSGGVDSSLVTQLMIRNAAEPPKTFGIGFRSHGADSEAHAAVFAADALGVPHTTTWVDDEDYLDAWPASYERVGEPVANSSSLLLGMLCRTVCTTHKVVLTGQGADEPLGGYPRHAAERFVPVARRWPRLATVGAQRLLGGDAGDRFARVLREGDRIRRYVEIFSVLGAEEVDRLVPAGEDAMALATRAVSQWTAVAPDPDGINALLYVDARMSLADDLLVVADHFSMAASVELRVPFLDLQLFELLERMPSRYKISGIGERKWLYRRAAAQALPPRLGRRLLGPGHRLGRKRGFLTPFDRWFEEVSGPLRDAAHWMQPLRHFRVFSDEALHRVAGSAIGSTAQRQRLLLYALAAWSKPLQT